MFVQTIGSLVLSFLLLVAAADCDCSTGAALRDGAAAVVPINSFYCDNITKGVTEEDWKTRVVELPRQHVDQADSEIVVDYFVNWPYYLKGMKVTICNSVGHRPNISWPKIAYSPVQAHCSYEDFPRCPLGLEIHTVQYQSWWPWD